MAIIYHVVNLFKPIIVIFYDMKSILERYFFNYMINNGLYLFQKASSQCKLLFICQKLNHP